MIRECTETDREILVGYLEEDSYGQAIFHLIDEFGFEQKFQSVYMDIEEFTKMYCFIRKRTRWKLISWSRCSLCLCRRW